MTNLMKKSPATLANNTLPKKTLVILRTSSKNQAAKSLYERLEFEQLAMTQMVSQIRNGGTVREDLRIYLGKNTK